MVRLGGESTSGQDAEVDPHDVEENRVEGAALREVGERRGCMAVGATQSDGGLLQDQAQEESRRKKSQSEGVSEEKAMGETEQGLPQEKEV